MKFPFVVAGAVAMQMSVLTAAPHEITDRDFHVASVLHRIYEFSVQEEKIVAGGGAKSPVDALPAENLKASVKELEGLADVPALRARLSKDLEEAGKSGLGPRHPTRRWLELLSRSLEKYSGE